MAGVLGVPGLDGYRAAIADNQARTLGDIQMMQGVLGLQQGMQEQQMLPLKLEQLQMQIARQKQIQSILGNIMGGVNGQMPSAEQALAQGAAQGDVGPTVTNAARMQPQGAPQGNGIDLPPNIQMALLSGDPGLEKWAAQMSQQYKPTDKIREAIALGMKPGSPEFNAYIGTVYNQGGAWQVAPGGGIRMVPGYAEGQGAVKGAEAAAQAPYQYQDFTIGGRNYRMSTQDYQDYTAQPTSESEAIKGMRVANKYGLPYSKTIPAAENKDVRGAAPTLGALFGSPTESEKTYDSARAKQFADDAAKFAESWQSGNQQRDNLDLLDRILSNPSVASGYFGEGISDLKGVASSFGINVAGKSDEDLMRALTREMALKLKNQGGTNLMPGAMSNFEQQILGSMVPSLSQSKPGRMILAQVMRAKLERDMKISEMAAEYESSKGRLDSGFYTLAREWLKANPTFPAEKQKAMLELARRLAK